MDADKVRSFMVRLTTDDDLRASLASNPQETLRSVGANIPEGVSVEVVEETDDKTYFVMPRKVESPERELSDQELAPAAGGAGCLQIGMTNPFMGCTQG